MMKSAIILFFAAFLTISAKAQNVQEGVNNLYSERHQSAKAIFEKLLAANPNNIEAVYWLGQTHLGQNNIEEARNLYSKALSTNGNAPLLLVGMGHVELMEGKQAEARQKFETALTSSRSRKGNDPAVLNAIGKANVSAYTDKNKYGDLDYAIAKLNEAAQIAPANNDIFLNLGNAHRKKHNGSEAVQAYRRANNFAPAMYRTAMLYKTQINYRQADNWGVVLDNLNNAIAADPRFAPAYEELYYYNLLAKKDFATAETFANKYITSSDPSPENEYLRAQTLFVQNKYDEAINLGKNIISQTNNNPKPRVYRLLVYSYMGAKDTATACQYSNEFFAKANEEEILGQDYLAQASSCGRGNPEILRTAILKAVSVDSVLSRQVIMLNDAAKDAKAAGQRLLEAELNVISFRLRGEQVNATELINDIALPYFFGGDYERADSAAKAYIAAAPDSIYGHYWSALANERLDPEMEKGLAMPAYTKVLELALEDKERLKAQGVRAAQLLAIYSFNIKSDKTAAMDFTLKGLEFDPANANLLNIKNTLEAQSKPTSNSKPATTTKNPPKKG
jgi:tetratricopeptide (TPR) repeat protein